MSGSHKSGRIIALNIWMRGREMGEKQNIPVIFTYQSVCNLCYCYTSYDFPNCYILLNCFRASVSVTFSSEAFRSLESRNSFILFLQYF